MVTAIGCRMVVCLRKKTRPTAREQADDGDL